MSRDKRLSALEAAQVRPVEAARREVAADVLHEIGRRVLLALPDDLRADMEARGPAGLEQLRAAYLRQLEPGTAEILPSAALSAYRAAFGGRA